MSRSSVSFLRSLLQSYFSFFLANLKEAHTKDIETLSSTHNASLELVTRTERASLMEFMQRADAQLLSVRRELAGGYEAKLVEIRREVDRERVEMGKMVEMGKAREKALKAELDGLRASHLTQQSTTISSTSPKMMDFSQQYESATTSSATTHPPPQLLHLEKEKKTLEDAVSKLEAELNSRDTDIRGILTHLSVLFTPTTTNTSSSSSSSYSAVQQLQEQNGGGKIVYTLEDLTSNLENPLTYSSKLATLQAWATSYVRSTAHGIAQRDAQISALRAALDAAEQLHSEEKSEAAAVMEEHLQQQQAQFQQRGQVQQQHQQQQFDGALEEVKKEWMADRARRDQVAEDLNVRLTRWEAEARAKTAVAEELQRQVYELVGKMEVQQQEIQQQRLVQEEEEVSKKNAIQQQQLDDQDILTIDELESRFPLQISTLRHTLAQQHTQQLTAQQAEYESKWRTSRREFGEITRQYSDTLRQLKAEMERKMEDVKARHREEMAVRRNSAEHVSSAASAAVRGAQDAEELGKRVQDLEVREGERVGVS